MAAIFSERPTLDNRGLPRIMQRALDLVDANGTRCATCTFNPNSAWSRILAEQHLREEAQRLDATSEQLGNGVDDGVAIRFADLRERRRAVVE
jgi:hypothetical protein